MTRVSEAGAFEGEHHLRLSNGGATHQNIPASDGDTVTVTLWMRGAADGDRASITLDFRDQGAGGGTSTPMRTQTETKTLTATWQQYSMDATAPSGDSRPVYHARVTLAAEQDSVVDLDSVQTSVAGVWCGDGSCGPGENQCACAADCGAPPSAEAVCSDGFDQDCDGDIDCADADCSLFPACAVACNANGICEAGESCSNCSSDCASVIRGKPSNRFCCGNGILEGPEGDGRCDGNI